MDRKTHWEGGGRWGGGGVGMEREKILMTEEGTIICRGVRYVSVASRSVDIALWISEGVYHINCIHVGH